MTSGVNFIGLLGALSATVPLAWLLALVSWRDVFVGVGAASLLVAALTGWLAADHPSTAAQNSAARNWRADLVAVMKNRATWPAFWVNFGLSGSYMSFVGLWLAPLLTQGYGKSASAASQHAAVIIAALAISSVVVARISDRCRQRKPVLLVVAGLYLGLWATWLIGVPADCTFALCVLTGTVAPGFMFAWSLAKEVNPPAHAGMAISVANTGGFLAAGILQPLAGALLDWHKAGANVGTMADFRFALSAVACFAVIGFIGALFVHETNCRNIWAPRNSGKPT